MKPMSASGRDDVLREFVKHRSKRFAFILSAVRSAEEILQEVAVVVCGRWEDFRPGTNFSRARTALVRCVEGRLAREEGAP